jgi:type I restriction enzyme S subunit
MTQSMVLRPFGELAQFRNGVNFSAVSRGVGDLAMIGVGDFQANERLTNFAHLERIARPKGLQDDALLRDGDLVFVRSNGNKELIGRCMVLVGIEGPVSHSGFTIRARLMSSEVAPEWIGQYFATGLAKRAIMRRGGGTNISNLSQQILQELPIPVPDQRYQRKVLGVAEVLSRERELIELALGSKRDFSRGLAQQLLTGQNRFPEFASCSWGEVRLCEVFTERNETNRPDLPLLSVTGRRGIIPRGDLEKRDTSNPDKSKYKRVAVGDIAYNTMRMWQGVSGLSSLEGIVSPAYTVAVPTGRIDGRFAKHLFKFRPIVHLFHRYSQGLVDDTLNLKFDRFGKIRVWIPVEVEEQRRIAETLDLVDREITLLEALVEQTALQKGRLMQALLSGEIRVPEVGEATA